MTLTISFYECEHEGEAREHLAKKVYGSLKYADEETNADPSDLAVGAAMLDRVLAGLCQSCGLIPEECNCTFIN